MEKLINLPGGGHAFITGGKDDTGCEHSWDGEGLITFENGETLSETEYKNLYESMSQDEFKEWGKEKGTVMGECTCSMCGMPYTQFNNPYYL